MKRILLLLAVGLSSVSMAQNVTFNDALFKDRVVNNHNPVIDLNGDGEIQIQEAAAYTGTLVIDNLGISDLTGLEWFLSIQGLKVNGNQLTSLDISGFQNLRLLHCSFNQLTSLNVANGNNSNFVEMLATNNSNLDCIQHDSGFNPSFASGTWHKDSGASWSDNCSNSGGGNTSSINENSIYFNIFPNPANDVIQIESDSKIQTVNIIDFTGKIILTETSNTIDVSILDKGVYFVKVSTENGETTKQFVKL